MRGALGEMMPDTATIQRRTAVSDSGGGRTYTWATAATVTARISPIGGGEGTGVGIATRGDRVSEETTHIVTLPQGTDVRESDRVVIAGVTFEVTAVRKRGMWELSRRVECKEAP